MSFGNLFSTPMGWVILIALILFNLRTYISSPASLFNLLLSIPAIVIAITFHEFAHAFVADKLGDDIPRKQGRLTLNPLKHLDPIGSVMLLFAGFGWGKPVNTNPYNYRRTISMKTGSALVALAGPVMNFVLALIFAIVYAMLSRLSGPFWASNNALGTPIISFFRVVYTINLGLGVFNLIPLPPLDGSKILVALLPEKASDWYILHQDMLYIVFVIFWITPISTMVIEPLINIAMTPYEALVNFIMQI